MRIATLVVLVGAVTVVSAQSPSEGLVEWPYYGGDLGGSKYSALTDITRENVQRLQVAWGIAATR